MIRSARRLRLKPRFYIITGTVFFTGTSLILGKAYLKDNTGKQGEVIAAHADNISLSPTHSPYDLIASSDSYITPQSEPKNSEIITISHTAQQGETVYSIAEKFHADPQTIVDYPYNNIGDDLSIKVGQTIIIPNGYIDEQQRILPPPIPEGTGEFMWPVHGVITQYSSWFHPGAIDIAIPIGTDVVAADQGTVIAVEHFKTGYGNHVIIDHGNGLVSLYGHLSVTKVEKGQGIQKGELLGLSGSTGRSTGPHLHFEVRKKSVPTNPMLFLSLKDK